jgi:hypothetical protein
MSANTLTNAKKEKNDEFYTQIRDIEHELCHYKEQLHDKVIFCNCDDPVESNFWRYFALKFKHLGLKKLIATHFEATKPSYKLELTGDMDENGEINDNDIIKTTLRQNGDFRSPECIELLEEADIVITNPPFSLLREYVAQLIEDDKKFLIIGNINAITYKEIFPLIRDNKMWLGESIHSGDREFRVPNYYPLDAAGCRIDENGNRYIRVKGVRWFTNLDVHIRHESITLYKKYLSEEYPKYDNYDAIEVSKTADIPLNYNGLMGVPITFIDKYNPEQFDIIGQTGVDIDLQKGRPYINGKRMYARLIIKRKDNKNEN